MKRRSNFRRYTKCTTQRIKTCVISSKNPSGSLNNFMRRSLRWNYAQKVFAVLVTIKRTVFTDDYGHSNSSRAATPYEQGQQLLPLIHCWSSILCKMLPQKSSGNFVHAAAVFLLPLTACICCRCQAWDFITGVKSCDDFIIYTHYIHITASSIVTDDVTS